MMIPYLEQYFGLWAMDENSAESMRQLAMRMDLSAHMAQVRAGDAPEPNYLLSVEDGVAVFNVRGMLMKQESSMSASTSTVMLRRQLRAMATDNTVKAVALVIESPGGTLAGMPELADDLAALSALKPTVAYIEDIGASGAYFLASQARKVYANAAAIVGSIGTYQVVYDLSAKAAMEGIKVHVIRAEGGDFKGAGMQGTEITDKQLKEWQRLVNAGNEHFLTAVMRGRKMTREQLATLADGRVHPAADAMKMGLIDGVQTWDKTLADLKAGAKQTNSVGGRSVGDINSAARVSGPESETVMSQDNAAPATNTAAHEPKPATIAELKAAFPSDPTFALDAAEKALTMTEAKAAYADVLAARIQQKDQEIDGLKAKQPGNKALGAGDAKPVVDGGGDSIQTWNAKMSELVAGGKMSREQAVRSIVQNHPEMHQAYIEAVNAKPRR